MRPIPMVLSNLHIYCELLNYELKTKDLLRYLFGCHDNQATTEVMCVANRLLSQETFMPNMKLIQLKTMELLRCKCGCHGNQATIATKSVANLYCL